MEMANCSTSSIHPQRRVERFGWTFTAGREIMQIVSNYDGDVYNGDVGVVRRVDLGESELIVRFDGREITYDLDELDELALAYATTIHKSQSSGYPAVIIALTQYPMLARNLFYTGVIHGEKLSC